MDAFLDLFGLKRRENQRVAVNWLVDIKVPDSDGFIGLTAHDVSTDGIRLQGNTTEAMRRILSQGKRVNMSIKMPGGRQPLEVVAVLKWGPSEQEQPFAGWAFTQVDRETKQTILQYIEDHPEDVLEEK